MQHMYCRPVVGVVWCAGGGSYLFHMQFPRSISFIFRGACRKAISLQPFGLAGSEGSMLAG